jgi:hypothetical protein
VSVLIAFLHHHHQISYHLEAQFLKGNANYTIRIEIAAINANQPQNKMADQFSLRTIV